MKLITLMIIAGLLFSGTALASQCPADMKKIDQALEAGTVTLTEAQRAEVVQLRAEGERLHKAGQHRESVQTLAKARNILGIDP